MNIEEAAAQYHDAKDDLAKYREDNLTVLAQDAALRSRVDLMAEQLKEAAMATLAPGASASYRGCPLTRVVAKGYDLDILFAKAPHARSIPGLVKEGYDGKVLAGAIKAGIISADDAEAAKVVVRSDSVRIG